VVVAGSGTAPAPGAPLVAWPGWRQLRVTGLLALGFALFWLVVYGGTSALTRRYPVRLRVHMGWELGLPFVPELSAVYLSLGVLLLLLLFVFRTWPELVPLVVVMSLQTLVAAACFLVLPVQDAFPPVRVTGPWGALFSLADTLNFDGNYLPSLHVAYAVTAALAIGRRAGPVGRSAVLAWAAAIAASTMLLHQHYLADVVAGFLLATLTMRVAYARAATPAFLRALRVEALGRRALERLARADARLARLEGRPGAAVLRPFHRLIRRLAARAARAHGWSVASATGLPPARRDAAANRAP
jgi:membrane-associated phospholipid phosphatase